MASGPGVIQVEARDETGKMLDSWVMEISGEEDDNLFTGVPLSRQYTRKFESRFTGVSFKFKTKSKGLVRIVGFTINLR
jgi:hypothetical protein